MRRLASPAVFLAVLAALVLLLVAAVTTSTGLLFWAALAAFAAGETLLLLDDRRTASLISSLLFSAEWQLLLRQMLVVAFLLRAEAVSPARIWIVLAAALVSHVGLGLQSALRRSARRRRLRRLETRNLDVPCDELPPGTSTRAGTEFRRLPGRADALVVAALGWAWVDGSFGLLAPAAVAAAVIGLVPLAVLLPRHLSLLRLVDDTERLEAAQRAVRDLGAQVILYFSGNEASVYQLNMWLATMERLERTVLVLVRERRYFQDIAPTSLPVLCLPFSVDVMNFELPDARVGLYVANVGPNIHLLREPGIKSAFIGHGDSDKVASFNPVAKVFDEVWVAGEAGRQRYVRAQVGVRPEEIVIVGRPQLDVIEEPRPRPEGAPFTVLYAPTWEGWTEDLAQSSVLPLGTDIVRRLLATPGIRVVYKPHPLTGSVDPAVTTANLAIIDLIVAAGGPHLAVLDNSRALYDLFNESDALISDVSSVVSDYVKSGKPYFVTNTAGASDAAFREENPSAGAAALVGPGAAGLGEGLTDARGVDAWRADRIRLRSYLLGDAGADAMDLFRSAVDSLAARARGAAPRPGGGHIEPLGVAERTGTGDDSAIEAGV